MGEYIKHKKQFVIHFLTWIFFLTIILTQLYVERGAFPEDFFARILLKIITFYINYIFLVPLLLFKKKHFFYFLLVAVLLTVNFLFDYYILERPDFVINNLDTLPKSIPVLFTSMFIIVSTSIKIYEVWKDDDDTKKEIVATQNLSELEALKNQLSPHFLFNSLNSIYSLTRKKSNDAPEAVITLSELMRYMLYQADDEFVLLQQELDYIQNYIKLQRLRIANNENVRINIHGSISSQKIRPLLFISFIENAFKYGTDFKGNTEVKIEISIDNDELYFMCSNIIGDSNVDKENSGIGLQNTIDRLQLLYPERHSLDIMEENEQFTVKLSLKLD
ncbi:sensor histidine kinase [Kordia jejudonensis]|uniref:sensor histidine kinase n=1 Tax=Kordia jejudonensis TaxID=1348245 RepID=UPI0009E63493|nr:histidine kinase [Kordia jejudonensis]